MERSARQRAVRCQRTGAARVDGVGRGGDDVGDHLVGQELKHAIRRDDHELRQGGGAGNGRFQERLDGQMGARRASVWVCGSATPLGGVPRRRGIWGCASGRWVHSRGQTVCLTLSSGVTSRTSTSGSAVTPSYICRGHRVIPRSEGGGEVGRQECEGFDTRLSREGWLVRGAA